MPSIAALQVVVDEGARLLYCSKAAEKAAAKAGCTNAGRKKPRLHAQKRQSRPRGRTA
jgi:hypothetical protein